MNALPRHVAAIMDGNGRWATSRGLPRLSGHKAGCESIKQVVKTALKLKLEVLTLFAFSLENWQRPLEEVNYIFKRLIVETLRGGKESLKKYDISLRIIGDMTPIDPAIRRELKKAVLESAENQGLKLVIALRYSGTWDILEAARKLAAREATGELMPEAITKADFEDLLSTQGLPAPDLLIRTGGECRISNFMLWQLAYTECYFTKILWPDFDETEFLAAINEYQKRERRFGKC